MSDPSSKNDTGSETTTEPATTTAAAEPEPEPARTATSCRIVATDEGVVLAIGGKQYLFDAATADGMSAALRNAALEHRNGGALS